jgi:arylsulfatase A-like enzyme
MNRRAFIGAATASALLAFGGSNLFSANATQRKRPNIVFILADDMGWGDLSIYGQSNYRTPNIDRLARQGTRFTNSYANQTVCTPTRVAFYTGRYPARVSVGLYEPLPNASQVGDSVGLSPDHPTIASLLTANGYETALVGKWHCGYLPSYSPLKIGFSEYLGNYSGAIDYFTHKDGSGFPDFFEGESPVQKAGYAIDLYTQRAVEFIKRPRNNPFYLSLHYNAPHWPWEGPDDEALSKNFYNTQPFTSGGSIQTYAAMVTRLDRGVGRVLRALEESGQAENTLVIFASDNGGERYSHIGPFQGRKGSLYEGGIRVPTIVRWPNVVQSNRVSNQTVVTFDLTATILAATGTRPDPHYPLDGLNLLPVLKGTQSATARTLFWRYAGGTEKAVRSGKWKYLKIGDTEALYDLSTDTQESTDLKADHPQILARLRDAFAKWEAQVLPYPPQLIPSSPPLPVQAAPGVV